MVLFLRDKNNNSLVDLNIYKGKEGLDCNSVVDVVVFADLLLKIEDYQKRESFIKAMYYFQEIREEFFNEKKNNSDEELIRLKEMIKFAMLEACKKFNLWYVED